MLTKGISAVLGLAGLLLMTRYLSTEQYGTITWTLAFLTMFNSVADLGFGTAHTKRVSEGHDLDACVSTFAYVKGLLTLAMVLLVLLAVGILTITSEQALTASSVQILLILLIYQVLGALTSIATTTFDARVQTAKSQLIFICDPLVRIPLLAVVLTGGLGITSVAHSYIAGGIGAIAVASYLISKERIVWQRPTMIHSYAKWAIPMTAAVIAGAVISQLPIMTIGLFWPKSDVAYYSSSLFLLSYLGILGGSMMVLLFPTFSKLSIEGRFDDVRKASKMGERYLSIISLPIVTVIMVFPSQIAVMLFGDEFLNAGKVLPYLAAATYIGLLNLTVSAQILGMNRVGLYMKWMYANLVLMVILLIVLVPSRVLGMNALGLSYQGAAIASTISAIVSYAIARWLTFNLTRAKPDPSILKHIVTAALVALIMYYASSFYAASHWYDVAVYLLVSLGAFLSILYIIKEFTAQDIRFFLNNLNIGKLGRYVKEELSSDEEKRRQ